MKKFLLLILTAGLAFMGNSQSAILMPLRAGDTLVTSSGTDTVFKTLTATAGYSVMTIQIVATKLSGTVSAKAYLLGSLDGTNYFLTDSSAAFTDVATNTVFFSKAPPAFTSFRVQVRQATTAPTTQSVICRVWYSLKKYDD